MALSAFFNIISGAVMPQHILLRDFETRSTLSLPNVGAWRYATHSTTDVLCYAYCVDDDPIKLWLPGDPTPPEWIEAAHDPDWIVAAFNNNFERQIETHLTGPRYGWPLVPIERHRCLMASSLALALPGKLQNVAKALELEHQKDDAGTRNMMALARPRKLRKGEPPGVYWHADPARLERLYAYCKQDIETERALYKRIGLLPPEEQAVWTLDATINDRGVYIDAELATGAIKTDKAAHKAIDAELSEITGGEVTSIHQVAKLKSWLAAHGCEIADNKKDTVHHALTRKDTPPAAKRALELRRDGAGAAAGKYETMMAWRADDGRARGAFNYHGASTGRWSSLGIQLQNLKKTPSGGIPAETINAIKTGDPLPLSVIGDVVRGAFCARPDHQLVTADFSGIEARVTAWLAHEQSTLDAWAKFDRTGLGEDEPYYLDGAAAGQTRDKGKTMTLAFGFAGGIGAYRKLAAKDDPATDAEIERLKQAWRHAHPKTVKFWNDIEYAAIEAVQKPGNIFKAGQHISFCYDNTFLKMRLPSGRNLSFPFPRLHTNERGYLTIIYKDNAKGKWIDCAHFGRPGTWKGQWVENSVQAVARDLFAAAMPRAEAAGYPIVLHVHDEIVAEVPKGVGDKDEFIKVITTNPDWATGLPIAAKGDVRERFCKIKPAPPHDLTASPTTVAGEIPTEPEPSPANPICDDNSDVMDNVTMHNADGYPNGEDHGERPQRGPSFTYLDEHGRPYLRVTRTIHAGKKIFPQEHWNGGGWLPTKPPNGKIPYRLPELIAAPLNEPVFVCEGEKDADAVAALGLVATTNPGGGIPKSWTGDLSRWFAGRKTVYILEDNDATGRSHANAVADALLDNAKEIRIVPFPELPEHGDVSDWIDQGGTNAQLLDRAVKGRLHTRPEPFDYFSDQRAGRTAAPHFETEYIPNALQPFVIDTAERMGVDPAGVAMGCLAVCASVVSDDWQIQPKRYDYLWTENARLWVAIVGDPSIVKSPMLRACIRPIAKMEAEARDKYRDEMIQYKNDVARAKSTKTEEPQHPRLARHMIENVSIEAISEVLRSDGEGTMYAPASKVLAYQDEMGEFFANMDKYRAGGKGGDRGTYLRLYNGGAHSIDRIIRGSIWCKDWSAGFLGGIQPAPIQRIAKYCDDDGLLQRFMYCVPSGRYPECDRRPDTIAIARYHSIVVGLARLPPPQEVVQLDEGAHAHREAVNELLRMEGRNAEKRLKSTLEKWRGLFARLCLTFHLIEEMENRPMGKLVSEATARRVRKFIEHIALPHLMRADAVMFSTEQTEHAKWIAGHILSKNLTRIQMRDVAMAYRALRPPECKQERESVMASLVAAGWLESEEPKYRATGICAWMVNPRVHEAF